MQGAGAWTTVGDLPVTISGPKGVSLNNNIFMMGNNIIIQKLSFIIILILQEDGMEAITVTTFYNSTLMMEHGKKLERCSMPEPTME